MTAAPTECAPRALSPATEVAVDPIRLLARVGGAASWRDVLTATAKYGLVPVTGPVLDAGVIADTLGAGLSPVLGRRHGYAADQVRLVETVTADGIRRRVTVERDPDLFWALCHGAVDVVVTAMVFTLFPYREFHGGVLRFAGTRPGEVLHAWRDWAPSLPDESTTSVLVRWVARDLFVTDVRFAHLGTAGEARRLLTPIRARGPVVSDSTGRKPMTAIGELHTGRPGPATGLRELSAATVDELVRPGQTWTGVELHALGGAYDRAPRVPDAVPGRGAAFRLNTYS
ncbi:hypothetical protein ACWEOE_29730 [Amycolatopsis sp. NPDC004368]